MRRGKTVRGQHTTAHNIGHEQQIAPHQKACQHAPEDPFARGAAPVERCHNAGRNCATAAKARMPMEARFGEPEVAR